MGRRQSNIDNAISPAEQAKRQGIFERALRLIQSEGLTVPAHVLAQGQRYIVGEIEIEDALKAYSGIECKRAGLSR
jgi:hypothetical protein